MAFLGEIRMIARSTAPNGWAMCNGQLLPVNQNIALFSLLGTNYGGDGVNNFGLPDLRGRVPMHVGNGHTLGETGGTEAVTLTIAQMPSHVHLARASGGNANSVIAAGNLLAVSQGLIYLNPNDVAPVLVPLNTNTVANTGGGQPHLNMQPFMTVNFMIALQGVFPSSS
jgi:microcystin-dependent protein